MNSKEAISLAIGTGMALSAAGEASASKNIDSQALNLLNSRDNEIVLTENPFDTEDGLPLTEQVVISDLEGRTINALQANGFPLSEDVGQWAIDNGVSGVTTFADFANHLRQVDPNDSTGIIGIFEGNVASTVDIINQNLGLEESAYEMRVRVMQADRPYGVVYGVITQEGGTYPVNSVIIPYEMTDANGGFLGLGTAVMEDNDGAGTQIEISPVLNADSDSASPGFLFLKSFDGDPASIMAQDANGDPVETYFTLGVINTDNLNVRNANGEPVGTAPDGLNINILGSAVALPNQSGQFYPAIVPGIDGITYVSSDYTTAAVRFAPVIGTGDNTERVSYTAPSANAEVAFNSLPESLQLMAVEGAIVYDENLNGFVNAEGLVWRSGFSPDNSNPELGWMRQTDSYTWEGHNTTFTLEIAAQGIANQRYTSAQFSDRWNEIFSTFAQETFGNNIDNRNVLIQFAGEYNQSESSRDYMQTYIGNMDGSVYLALQSSNVGNDIVVRIYFQETVGGADVNGVHYSENDGDNLTGTIALAAAMILIDSRHYATNDDIINYLSPTNPIYTTLIGGGLFERHDILPPLITFNGQNS